MGEQVRGVLAETVYNRRWLVGVIAGRGQSPLVARVFVAMGLGGGTAMVVLFADIVAVQLDVADPSNVALGGPVLAAGLALGAILGVCGFLLHRPGEVERTQGTDTLTMDHAATSGRSAIALAAQEKAACGESLRVKVSMGWTGWVLSLGIGGVIAASMYFIFPVLALLGLVVGGIVGVFCRGTAVIGPDGVKVLASGFRRVMPLDWKGISKAEVADIKAMDYGGWGYRMSAGSIGFIMGNGPALVMTAGFQQKFVISMPDVQAAGEAAALVNAYLGAAAAHAAGR